MGNVQNRGKTDQLTKFQREKLKYDFYTFFGKSNNHFQFKTFIAECSSREGLFIPNAQLVGTFVNKNG